jgi:ubiquitin C-terminal hydrolase
MIFGQPRRGRTAISLATEYRRRVAQRRRTVRAGRKEPLESSCVVRPRSNHHSGGGRMTFVGMLNGHEIEALNFTCAKLHSAMEKITPASDPSKGFGGIVNMGLTCYGNAVIQNLRHLPKLVWVMEEGKYNTLFKKGGTERRQKLQNVTSAFAEIVQLAGKCDKGQSVRPGKFWKNVPAAVEDTMYEQLAQKRCHDSHEFFLFLLEAIHESTVQDVDMRITRAPPANPEEELVHGALKAWQQAFTREYSPFVHMFYGMFHQKTVCQECKNVSHRWEPFNSLKIPVPTEGQSFNLMDSLRDDMLKDEIIDEYVCDNCGPPRRQAKKCVSIWRLPLTLVLSMKRFGNDGRKIRTPVAALTQGPIDFSPYFSAESPERLGEVRYAIRGMVDHHGTSDFGHYTAQCRHTGNNNWFMYDDDNVGTLPAGPHFGESTYMIFLERYTGGLQENKTQ